MPVRNVLRWVYVVAVSLFALVLVVGNVRLYHREQSTADVVAQLRFLRTSLQAGSADDMQELFPEGYLFSYVLYGLTWADVSRRSPGLRAEGLREIRWALRHADSAAGRAPFDARQVPSYGIFYRGWTARLRGEVVRLAGARDPQAARLSADCAAIARALRTDGPFPESYPGEAWPVDSVVAVAALRLHDRVLSPRYDAVVSTWVAQARRELDPATGLLPHRSGGPGGRPPSKVESHRSAPVEEGPRGSSQSIVQRFLPEVDMAFASEQYGLFRERFVDRPLGLPGVREYPKGRDGPGDVDSGPLLLGVSASATVVTIGAARAHSDEGLAGPLTGLGEATGMPFGLGDKRYAFGRLPIGDAFLAWSAAAPPVSPEEARPQVVPGWWRLPWHAGSLVLLALLAIPIVKRLLRTRRAHRDP